MDCYLIKTDKDILTARTFNNDDIEKIVNFAKSVTITSCNYKEYLGINSVAMFEKKGALLETNEEEIREIISKPHKYFSLALWSSEDEILAFLTVQLEDVNGFLNDKDAFEFRKQYFNKWDEWKSWTNKNKIAFKGDLAIRGGGDNLYVRDILFHIALKELNELNIKYCLTEVFYIISCDDSLGIHNVEAFNYPSFRAQVQGCGAEYVGNGPIKVKNIGDGIRLTYYPWLLEYNIPELYKKSIQTLQHKKIQIMKYEDR